MPRVGPFQIGKPYFLYKDSTQKYWNDEMGQKKGAVLGGRNDLFSENMLLCILYCFCT
jgi:hypothetical protein